MRKIDDGLTKQKRYRLRHPEQWKDFHRNQNMRYRQQSREVYRKYMKIENHSLSSFFPHPHLRTEFWNSSKIRVARESSGRFISWKEIN